jgi:hypothetical protein
LAQLSKNYRNFLPKKLSQKYGFGIRDPIFGRDPEKTYSGSRIQWMLTSLGNNKNVKIQKKYGIIFVTWRKLNYFLL